MPSIYFTPQTNPGRSSRADPNGSRRARSAFAPSPKCNFGPKGTLKEVQDNAQLIVIQEPASQRLHWVSSPSNILVVRKPGPSTRQEFMIIVIKLLQRGLRVYVESLDHLTLPSFQRSISKEQAERCIAFDQEKDLSKIDLVICLGGDGTLLHTSSIFQTSCPPVLSFALGSLGFLTPYDFQSHEQVLEQVLAGNVAVILRSRVSCKIEKDGAENNSSLETPQLDPDPESSAQSSDKESTTNPTVYSHLALNEVVIDRGPNSYLSNLDLYINDRFITKVQGDGLIISTPTGSTAYAMAAGSSMVHPNVPAMVICPICPHSLSFRPIVVPAGIELKVKVSEDTRLTAWLSVDGRNRYELHQQDSVKITTSVYPVPMICRVDQLDDWFSSLADILHWNLRKPQSKLSPERHDRINDDSSSSSDENKAEDGLRSSSVSASETSVDNEA